jgi:hypothetical protein
MTRPSLTTASLASIFTAASLLMAGCSTTPATSSALPRYEKQRIQLDKDFSLDYQLERKISTANKKTCYAFITGVVNNQSSKTLSQKSVLDMIVFSQGKQLFRDLTSPMADIPPGGSAMFEMVTSPVHKDGCPPYEKITVSLRKVLVD